MKRFIFSSVEHGETATLDRAHWNEVKNHIIQLETLLQEIDINAPRQEPVTLEPRTLSQAWSFWVVGQKVRQIIARSEQKVSESK